MNAEHFWQIIDSSRSRFDPARAEGNMEQQLAELRDALLRLPPGEVVDFANHFRSQMNRAYHWDLWGAAYIIAGGCSDDGFEDFRSWLISMGRRVFEDALSNPESLLDVADAPGVEDVFFEAFSHVPAQVHEERTGRELPPYPRAVPTVPSGERWSEDELHQRFPRLWDRYHG